MLKTRKRWISLLVTLAMLVAFVVPVGTAFAAAEYAKISGSYKFVDADDDQAAGTVSVAAGEDYDDANIDTIYAEITLPEGVEFTSVSSVTYGSWTREGSSDTSLTLSLAETSGDDTFTALTVENIRLDIDSDVTGNIIANVRVWAENTSGAIAWDVTDDVTIAKVASGDVTVTAASPKTLSVGSNRAGAKITIKEQNPGALTAGVESDTDNDILLTIKGSGVKWDKSYMDDAGVISTVGVALDPVEDSDFSNSDKVLRLDVTTGTTVINGKIEITPKFIVQPGASGDVVVKVSGDDVPTTELTVGKIGEGDVAVTVDKADKDKVYLGQTATFDDVEITLDPSIQLNDGDYITITLPEGVKWQDVVDPIDSDSGDVTFNSLYNDDRSLWMDIANDEPDDVTLTDLKVLADYNAEVGDLEITFGGAVEGTYKVGTIAAPFTVTAEATAFPQRGSDVAGGKIVITEAGDGALVETDGDDDKTDGQPAYLDIVLPMGVTFAQTPDVDVTDGDLDLGNVTLNDDNNVLQIEIDGESNSASTIEITDIYYNVDNRAAIGDVVAKIGKEYNLNSSNYLASVKLGTIASPTAVNATLKIGDTTITINGVDKTMDAAPYIKDGRTFIPVRYAANAVGVADDNILWDAVSKKVTVIKGDRIAQFTIGSNVMTINGAAVTMDAVPEIVAGRTMLPVSFVAQALGANITWDGATQVVTITAE